MYNFTEGEFNPPAEPIFINALLDGVGFKLPNDYVSFLRSHDGGEGFVGDNYIIFWKAEELIRYNQEYEVEIYAPGIFLFASSGGGEGYGFDTSSVSMPIVRVPFIGMSRECADFFAQSFSEFFVVLSSYE